MSDILIVNHDLATVCGVHDLGLRMFAALPHDVEGRYIATNSPTTFHAAVAEHQPKVVVVNYRPDLMGWIPGALSMIGGVRKVAVAHHYDADTILDVHTEHTCHGFDTTIALELPLPGQVPKDIVFAGRPLPTPSEHHQPSKQGPPRIGSFGFAFRHKGFDTIVTDAALSFSESIVRVHCPTAAIGGSEAETSAVIDAMQVVAKDFGNVDLAISTDHRPGWQVVDMLSANDVNCLYYQVGHTNAGLSSALDFLIAAQRPIHVTNHQMFRVAAKAATTRDGDTLRDVWLARDRHGERVVDLYHRLTGAYTSAIHWLLS